MKRADIPSSSAFRRSLVATSTVVSVAATVIMSGYLMTLLRLPAAQWEGFVQIICGLFAFLLLASQLVNRKINEPIATALDALREGSATPAIVRTGFACVCDLPRRTFVVAFFWWLLGGILVVAGMRLRFENFQAFAGGVMIAAAVSGGLVTDIFLYFVLRRLLAPVREALAAEIPDPAERRALVRPVPLGQKLRVSLAGVTLVTIGFAVLLTVERASRPVESFATQAQQALLAGLEGHDAAGLPAALQRARAEARRFGVAEEILIVDGPGQRVIEGPEHALDADEIAAIAAAEGAAGDSRDLESAHVFSWTPLPGERFAVASTPWSTLRGDLTGMRVVFGVLLVFSLAAALGIAQIVGSDVDAAAAALRREAERIAAGDLTPGEAHESEDELGDLARSFATMAARLRTTIGGFASAADRMESTAGEISAAVGSVGSVTVDQVGGIEQASVSMESLHQQVGGIAESAQALNVSVEESSSSILELGAVGEQLNQTASVLSIKVDEVSSSIEQMIRSVRNVGQNAESLASAAAETSTSMEEMAVSMRQVDTTAAETARLSSRVVECAETGRDRVRQTIEGMAAIREATETAERVIRSLGERSHEIGTIVSVIDDVADETNLLALNAAIIAAQAGDHGRAFSVVADQIKDLADRVLASTKEIDGLIRAVQEESANAIGAVERGSQSVQEGVDLSAEAGVSLEEITDSARQSGGRIAEIVSAVREQARAADHVVQLMEIVRAGVEQIRGASQEQERGNELVLRNAVTMRDVAQQVRATTAEQARGSGRIRESVENVRDAVEQIHRSLQEQSAACREAVSNLERVYQRTRTNEESTRRMGEAMRDLRRQAEALRADAQRFRM